LFVSIANFVLLTAILNWAIHQIPPSGASGKADGVANVSEAAMTSPPQERGDLGAARHAPAEDQGFGPLWGTFYAGIGILVLFASATSVTPTIVFALMLLFAGASALSGALVGVLFALPAISSSISKQKPGYNNNLLEISDWLTKILIGAGLVNLKDLVTWIGAQGGAIGRSAELEELAPLFGGSLIVFFFVWGFLFAYVRGTSKLRIDVGANATRRPGLSAAALILALLHSPEPGAADDAVELADALLAKPENEGNGRLWLYLARALGRQHASITDTSTRQKLADRAYKALEKALAIDPALKSKARDSIYPPTNAAGDLMTFAGDSRFQTLLGSRTP
jgi:hypothetical protein